MTSKRPDPLHFYAFLHSHKLRLSGINKAHFLHLFMHMHNIYRYYCNFGVLISEDVSHNSDFILIEDTVVSQ